MKLRAELEKRKGEYTSIQSSKVVKSSSSILEVDFGEGKARNVSGRLKGPHSEEFAKIVRKVKDLSKDAS